MLQSGSFFRQRWDRQESGFPRFRRISRFVGAVLHAGRAATPDPGHAHLRRARGEPRQQPRRGDRAAAAGSHGRAPRQPRRAQLRRLARRPRPAPDRPARAGLGVESRADGAHAPDRPAAGDRGGLVARVRDDGRRAVPAIEHGGERHEFRTERVTIEPFDLRMRPRHALVIDRLAHWYYVPREWIKKAALMDDVYLLNNPFTFQAMEKHSAYCAMIRLGMKVPDTWLVPHKQPPADERFAYTAQRYNQPFDLAEIAERIGYPLFMKPFDGGAWVGVSQVRDPERARRALRRLRPPAHAPPARGRRVRRVRPLALDRRRDDGHALRARTAAARPLPGRPRLPRRPTRAARSSRSAARSTRSSAGSSTPARR